MAARKNYTVNHKTGLNLREKPTKDSKVLEVLPCGKKITIDPKADTPEGWFAVLGGGYAMSQYLK